MPDHKDTTLDFYEQNAHRYATRTDKIDITDIHQLFLAELTPADRVLDLGCGPGRDAELFQDLGYRVTCVDGSAAMCDLARQRGLRDVRQANFDTFTAPADSFDAIWSMAAMLHVPWDEMPALLNRYADMLKVGGVFYMSFKALEEAGCDADGRYFNAPTYTQLIHLALSSGRFEVAHLWMCDDASGRPVKWRNLILRRLP